MWDQAADLFAPDATIESGQQGVYVGKRRVRAFLGLSGPQGLSWGWMNDHMQLQPIVDVAPDGLTARARSRELDLLGHVGGQGQWMEGVYENTFVKRHGVWMFKSLHFYPTFITDYDKGWAQDAQPVPTASTTLAAGSAAHRGLRHLPDGACATVPLPQSGQRRDGALPAGGGTRLRLSLRRPWPCRADASRPGPSRMWTRRSPRRGTVLIGSRAITRSRISRAPTATTSTRICGTIWPICSASMAPWSSRSAAPTMAANTCAPSC